MTKCRKIWKICYTLSWTSSSEEKRLRQRSAWEENEPSTRRPTRRGLTGLEEQHEVLKNAPAKKMLNYNSFPFITRCSGRAKSWITVKSNFLGRYSSGAVAGLVLTWSTSCANMFQYIQNSRINHKGECKWTSVLVRCSSKFLRPCSHLVPGH